jgi:hypothetical protein
MQRWAVRKYSKFRKSIIRNIADLRFADHILFAIGGFAGPIIFSDLKTRKFTNKYLFYLQI